MKKFVIPFVCILVLLVVGLSMKASKDYITIDGEQRLVFYPPDGFVSTGDQAIALCCGYINNTYFQGEDEFIPEYFQAEYDERLDAWIITGVWNGMEDVLDGFTMAIRKTDGKILMHSMTS